jgi:hypothetical protein
MAKSEERIFNASKDRLFGAVLRAVAGVRSEKQQTMIAGACPPREL